MPSEPKIEHKYAIRNQTAHRFDDFDDFVGDVYEAPVTTVYSHAEDSHGSPIGASIDIVHPITRDSYDPVVEHHNATKENPQMELFIHHGPTVDNYYSHSQSGHTAPVLLGIAANLSKSQFNEVPVPSTDLSEHSLRVVKQLGDEIPHHVELPSEPTNFMDTGPSNDSYMSHYIKDIRMYRSTPVSSEDIAKGSDTIKQVVQRRIDKRKQAKATAANPAPAPAPAPKATPPEQLRIPGM